VGSLLWACWVVLVYTSCVFRGAFRFFNKIFLTYQKKKKSLDSRIRSGEPRLYFLIRGGWITALVSEMHLREEFASWRL
jgi:hypothetical protein